MKKLNLVAVTIALCLFVSIGGAVKLYSHSTEIDINKEGVGSVRETFRLGLDQDKYYRKYNMSETDAFDKVSSEAGDNFDQWKEFHKEIEPSISGSKEDLTVSTSKTHRTHNVIVNYETNNITELSSKRGRIKTYRLKVESLRFYKNNTGVVIPDNTNLWIDLPDSTELDSLEISPEPINSFGGYEYHWNTGTWDIKLSYDIVEPISSWNIQGIQEAFGDTFIDNPVYGAVLIILIVLSVIYRHQIRMLFSEGLAMEEEPEKPKKQL